MNNPFTQVQMRPVKKNKFDLSHERKMSLKMGFLYPMLLEEILPGDSFKTSSEVFMRVAPMLAPVMHKINVYTHFFFVPNRLVWDEWEDFITGGEDGNADPVFPTIQMSESTKAQFALGQLPDYFGVPIADQVYDYSSIDPNLISALPFRGYQLIYNEWYRDQNLIEKVQFDKTSGPSSNQADLTTMRERAWQKDYFTSALPWSQRGGEAQIPLGSGEPIYHPTSRVVVTDTDLPPTTSGPLHYLEQSGQTTDLSGLNNLRVENIESVEVEPTTINDLRKAARVQEWLEKSARGGSRYIEQIKSFFGVTSSDARLQRPEYLGGGMSPITISEVLNTTGAKDDSGGGSDIEFLPQGEMAGHGVSVGRSNNFRRTFEEHGYVFGIISVTPKTAYQQGLHRTWRKFDKFDYYYPQFAHLGEQEITRDEIYQNWQQNSASETTFGYQQRYAEYKYKESQVNGDFRDSLAYWHLGRYFDDNPFLNQSFVTCRPRTDFLAVQDGTDYLWCQIYHKISALRPMPYFAIPTL